jgi:histidinol dehydrogenase
MIAEILKAVRREGDVAVARYASRFADPGPRRVSEAEIEAAYGRIDPELRAALHGSAARIECFARAQRASLSDVELDLGWVRVGHRATPFERAGIYVPAGAYPLPSTLLMCAIPARVAGVATVIACTPRPNDAILAAACVAGVDELHIVGGAQAIAAMAYGTQTIERVDIVVGPGNAHVARAKRLIFGDCGIDAIAGPSEVLIVASGDADARIVAADLIAQAEHDEAASAILVTDDTEFKRAVDIELERQLVDVTSGVTARVVLERASWARIMPLGDVAGYVNRAAPEHLELHGARAEALAPHMRTYGSLFVGSSVGEVFGDYGTGPNHVLPTGGTARFSSGLSVLSFLAIRTYQRAVRNPEREIIEQTAALAAAEGLDGHRRAALARYST